MHLATALLAWLRVCQAVGQISSDLMDQVVSLQSLMILGADRSIAIIWVFLMPSGYTS